MLHASPREPSPPRVSVVVVSYNTVDQLRRCLGRLADVHEVIVVDNASKDGSTEMVQAEFPAVHLIANAQNRGFGAANNQGWAVATGDAVLYLNSDAYAFPGAIERLGWMFSDPRIVAAGGRLENPDGSLQLSTANRLTLWAVCCEQLYLEKFFPNSLTFSPYWNTTRLPQEGPSPVEQVMGACLMVRRSIAENFDERFFLYCEDTELCHRLRKHGPIWYEPGARFTHELGSSSAKSPQDRGTAVARYNRGKELYFRIHHGAGAMALCFVLNRSGAFFRLLVHAGVWVASAGRRRDSLSLFWRVLTAPLRGPVRPDGSS